MNTIPVRIPDDVAASLKRVAAANGITPAEQMQRAWDWWWNRHGDAVCDDLHAKVEAMRPEYRP